MTFAHLALSNLRGSWLRYAAFLLSSTFSVALFYVYAQFLFHPDVANGHLYGGGTTRIVLTVCLVLIAVFAFFFVLYSSGAFLRARNKEFGLLTLMGTTRGQLRRLIWLENTFLSLAAIVAGILLGVLLSRLFLMAISRVLLIDRPIDFLLVPQALLITAAGFFLVFQLVTLVSAGVIGRRSVLDMLKQASKPRSSPRARPWLAVLGLLLVLGGYAVATSAQGSLVALVFVPVVTVVIVGTHLLFTQGGVFLMRRLARGRAYRRGTRMLVISQLVFRLADNARLLAGIASLSAVVLAAAGTFYVMSRQFVDAVDGAYPHALTLVETPDDRAPLARGDVDAMLLEHGAVATVAADIEVIETLYSVPEEEGQRYLVLVQESAYVTWVNELGAPAGMADGSYLVPRGQVAQGVDAAAGDPVGPVPTFTLHSGTAPTPDAIEARRVQPPTTVPPFLSSHWFVVDEAAWQDVASGTEPLTLAVYDWPGSDRATPLSTAVSAAIQEEGRMFVADKYSQHVLLKQTLGLSMFTGLFVSVLFFIGAGSLIYFKLFTELPDDRRLFARLRRVGITRRESDRVVSRQVSLVFLLPFAVGSVHAIVALNALGSLIGTVGPARVAVLAYAVTVVGLFAAVQIVFFLLTRWSYLRALLPRD
ncbi:MAG TPA: ABC transporter permease [Trueperaceae bacterium]|nr:ABC transporter permease [Trueperaceae bacterium]